jgi:Ni,Fe-hydrogenase III small subunit/Pyruvate/2-oxoacid:ferredoxin oxidoreductase delta subunit
MFDILRNSLSTGVVTTSYPSTPAEVSSHSRGRPEIEFTNWKDARPAVAACPTGALASSERDGKRKVTFDLGKCIYCGMCAEADKAIRMTNECELVARNRQDLVTTAKYELSGGGVQGKLIAVSPALERGAPALREGTGSEEEGLSSRRGGVLRSDDLETLGSELQTSINKVLGRSLHIREVDAGSCNGCEVEIVGLNSPVYDIERFGIHFVASPRHADMLLVTGAVSRNMELALRKTYEATPEPRLVVAVGACGCSGGIFGQNYATVGSVDRVVPVDVYVPGCPPNPYALLHGILTAISRLPA